MSSAHQRPRAPSLLDLVDEFDRLEFRMAFHAAGIAHLLEEARDDHHLADVVHRGTSDMLDWMRQFGRQLDEFHEATLEISEIEKREGPAPRAGDDRANVEVCENYDKGNDSERVAPSQASLGAV